MSPDFKDLLSEFNAHGVEYLVVGAYALAAHGRVRATGDLDVWVRPEPANAKRVLAALLKFGAPLQDLTEQDLSTPGIVYQVGVVPNRIDLLTSITGLDFESAWSRRGMVMIGELSRSASMPTTPGASLRPISRGSQLSSTAHASQVGPRFSRIHTG